MDEHRSQDGEQPRHRLLVVDDEPKICHTLSGYFEHHGFEVRTVLRGEEAFALLDVFHPDVVLLDILMPGMDGIEALKRLKRICPSTKVIMLTAVNHDEVVKGALKLGADFYVTKPVNFSNLEHLVSGFLPSR